MQEYISDSILSFRSRVTIIIKGVSTLASIMSQGILSPIRPEQES
jgi:hypothetical protein